MDPTSNIGRLLAAMHRVKGDRVPNFEIQMDGRILSHLLGQRIDGTLWNVAPAQAVRVAALVGQDAIPCPLHFAVAQASIETWEDLARVRPPDPGLMLAKLDAYLAAVQGTRIGVGVCMTGPLTAAYMAVGPVAIESFMYLLYDDQPLAEAVMDLFTDFYVALIHAIADRPFHFFYLGDDIGYNHGPMVTPGQLDTLWAPRYGRMMQAAREAGKSILAHCCGSQALALPYFRAWGVHATHPVQPGANDIYALHAEYGDALAFCGNIDVMAMLTEGSPDAVRADVAAHIERLASGGYICGSSHSIIDSVHPDNYLAMVDAVHRYGVYR